MKRQTVLVFIAAVFLILWGTAFAYAPDSSDLQQDGVISGSVQAENAPALIIDGKTVDLTKLFNSQVPLFNVQDLGGFSGSSASVIPREKRVHIKLNDAVIGLQFLNAAVAETETSFTLNYSGEAQAALVVTAPQVGFINNTLDLDTYGSGTDRICCLVDIENRNGETLILNMRQVPFPGQAAGNLVLVNGSNLMGKDVVPANLSNIPNTIPAVQSKQDMKLNSEAISALGKMLQAAKKEGVNGFILSSTYRPYSYQSMLFNNKVKQLNSEAAAARIVARPGTSEHQTGLAIDFSAPGVGLSEGFVKTAQGKWLGSNSWKYGFILRYPADKTAITKIIHEPWHFRYIGYPFSKIMYDRKLCLEELLYNLKEYGYYAVSDQNNTYVAVFDPRDNKVYLSDPMVKSLGV